MKYLSGNALIILLIVEYIIIAAVYGFEQNWGKFTYFVGATIISFGVLWMK